MINPRSNLLTSLALLLLACLPLSATLAQGGRSAPAPVVEGVDYVVIADGRPWQPLAGKIEVVEVFAYACGHCRDFHPTVEAWKRTLPRDVRFSYVPAAFDLHDRHARAFFAAEAQGKLGKTHDATFRALHDTGTLPARGVSVDELVAFHGGLGVNATRFKAALQSPAIDAKMNDARAFAVRAGVEGTPTLIINGRYRVQGRTLADLLRIADALIAQLRAEAAQLR
ncbi:MAG: thiol:disulfide interchange protein DsbA/DsbL [Pseudomonadota bacterium]|nr:thiol:disulfide interchange protein DsbA/DsbL [Pseudomonadota bacterium]